MARATISVYNGALAATRCTQRDNTHTYTTRHRRSYDCRVAVCVRVSRTHMHGREHARARARARVCVCVCARARTLSFVSLGIHMTMVMRPLPKGFSAHNAIPLVTDNGPSQLLVTCGLTLFASPSPFFFVYPCDFHGRVVYRSFLVTPNWRPLMDAQHRACTAVKETG